MLEELEKIKILMNEFSEKYDCSIEVLEKTITYTGDSKKYYNYNLRAIKPEETIAEI